MNQRLDKLAALQLRHAKVIAALALLLAVGSLPLVKNLGLDSRFTALLPSHRPSVVDLENIKGRVGGLSTLTVAVVSPSRNVEGMKRFARDLRERLEALPPGYVQSVDWNVAAYEEFVWENRHLYAEREDLEEIRDALQSRLERERARANPFYIDLEDEPEDDPRELIDRMKQKAEEGREKIARFEDGFYLHEDRDLIALFVRTDLSQGDSIGGKGLIAAVEREAQALDPSSYSDDLKIEFAGDVVFAQEEQSAIARELVLATIVTILLVLIAIYFFFRSVRAIGLLALALVPPVLATFGVAELSVDYLNTSTAFLGSIVVGNGVNPNVIWLSRYFEERRGGMSIPESVKRAHHGAFLATLAASFAAALAYGSLVLTDFRGFRDFGIIGGVGMVLCWISAVTLLPALCVLADRRLPIRASSGGRAATRSAYGIAFSKMVCAAPKQVLVASVLITIGAIGLTVHAVQNDPLEYDFKRLRSERADSPARRINARVNEIVSGARSGNGIAVVVPERSDTAPMVRWLKERSSEDPEDGLWGAVRSIDDLMPSDQEAKIPVLGEIREALASLREHADDETRAEIEEHIPPADLAAISINALPEDVARSFTERDGTRGRIVLVVNNDNIWDGRYLVRWAKALREYRMENGERPPLAGRAPVFADIVEAVLQDGPRAIAMSFFATLFLALLAFRRTRERFLTMLALLLGIVWMAGTMALAGMKLNFLNFVAFPITFGNGVDYGVNVMRRYTLERDAGNEDAVAASVERTGGAVALCSLTTVIGYSSLYTSANLAINSFGAAMAISEVTCLASAVLTMPALLLLTQPKSPTPADAD